MRARHAVMISARALLGLLAVLVVAGCHRAVPVAAVPPPTFSSPPIPRHVSRLAVLYPAHQDRDVAYGYERLEQAVLQVKRHRPWVRVLDRRDLGAITAEQRLQLAGRFADDSAVHLGRLLGADSIVLFHIEGPGWRERLLGRMHGTMPPVVISSKVVHVETGEILYHDMIVRTPRPGPGGWDAVGTDYDLQPVLRASLEQSLVEAIDNLHEAFR